MKITSPNIFSRVMSLAWQNIPEFYCVIQGLAWFYKQSNGSCMLAFHLTVLKSVHKNYASTSLFVKKHKILCLLRLYDASTQTAEDYNSCGEGVLDSLVMKQRPQSSSVCIWGWYATHLTNLICSPRICNQHCKISHTTRGWVCIIFPSAFSRVHPWDGITMSTFL